jgi:hypothetical protein
MTGSISSGSNSLSILTARSFQDMGYTIDPASPAIDPFNQQAARSARTSEFAIGANETVVSLGDCMARYKGPRYPVAVEELRSI